MTKRGSISLPDNETSGNSLILGGRRTFQGANVFARFNFIPGLCELNDSVSNVVQKIEDYGKFISLEEQLVASGARGRGCLG